MSATKRGGRRPKAIPPAIALLMLQSALGYCQQAGLKVKLTNEGGDCHAQIVGVQAATGKDGVNRFSLANPITTLAMPSAPALTTEAA